VKKFKDTALIKDPEEMNQLEKSWEDLCAVVGSSEPGE
jgi:hypothetical protein